MSTSFQTTSRHLLIAVLDELNKAGHHVTVIKKKVNGEEEELPSELSGTGIKCISVPVKSVQKRNLVARYIKDIEYIIKCKKYINNSFDAVFVQSTNIAGIVFYFLQKKRINAIKTLNVQDAFPDNAALSGNLNSNSLIYKLFRKMQCYAYKKCDHIITISADIKDLLIEYGIESEKINVVFNWSYQDDLFNIDAVNTKAVSHIFDKNRFHVVYAGNIGLMQNVDVLVDVALKMKDDYDICFDIIGDGTYKKIIQKRVNELGLSNVLFYPMQSSDLAPAIYCSANINVIPLKNQIYRTALPSKTATCLACHQPIIFAIGKNSKFGKWVSSQTGCPVIDTDNVQDFVDAIRLIKNGSLICNTEAVFKEHFSKTDNSRRYVEIITTKQLLFDDF